MEAPWWLTKHFEVRFEDPTKTIDYEQEFAGDGLRYEIRVFIDRVNGKSVEMDKYDRMSLEMARVMERQ